eukprot:scaffold6247_cov416-Prasinococcus_capsulatus_cf.AAC.12
MDSSGQCTRCRTQHVAAAVALGVLKRERRRVCLLRSNSLTLLLLLSRWWTGNPFQPPSSVPSSGSPAGWLGGRCPRCVPHEAQGKMCEAQRQEPWVCLYQVQLARAHPHL